MTPTPPRLASGRFRVGSGRHTISAWGAQPALRRRPFLFTFLQSELPTLRFHGPIPRSSFSSALLHGQSAPEAASDPRPCPELRRVPRPSIEGTAAAQASVSQPQRTHVNPAGSPTRQPLPSPRPLRAFDHVPSRANPCAAPHTAPRPIHSEDHSSPKTDAFPTPRPSAQEMWAARAAAVFAIDGYGSPRSAFGSGRAHRCGPPLWECNRVRFQVQ